MKPFARAWAVLGVLLTLPAGLVACSRSTSSGGAGGVAAHSSGGSSSGAGASGVTCPSEECGPALGLPNTICADGSVGGPTGRCLPLEHRGCGWEVRECPADGEGGAPAAGGASATGGAASAGSAGALLSDRCGGCNYKGPTPEICLFQAGGPGPGRFVCATQNPCGAEGACVCIVGQGTCKNTLQGGSPGYCVCDNGMD
jgi:hypothetical protein